MKAVYVILTVVVAIVLQTTLARYMVGGRWVFDLVLVGVVYAAVYWGPAAGMWAGTIGGMMQDLLSAEILGIGGFGKTISGFFAGVLSAQFIVTRPIPRMLVVAGATVVHRLIVIVLYGLIDQEWPRAPWGAILGETGANAVLGLMAFQATEALPGAISRNRMNRRTRWGRRTW